MNNLNNIEERTKEVDLSEEIVVDKDSDEFEEDQIFGKSLELKDKTQKNDK